MKVSGYAPDYPSPLIAISKEPMGLRWWAAAYKKHTIQDTSHVKHRSPGYPNGSRPLWKRLDRQIAIPRSTLPTKASVMDSRKITVKSIPGLIS